MKKKFIQQCCNIQSIYHIVDNKRDNLVDDRLSLVGMLVSVELEHN